MSKYFTNNFSVINLHKRPSVKSEIVTQMIYGDSFSISKKSKKWLKIKIKEDNYKGYIRNKKYSKYLKPTHKVNTLKTKIFKLPNKIKKKELELEKQITDEYISTLKKNEKILKNLKSQRSWPNLFPYIFVFLIICLIFKKQVKKQLKKIIKK